VRIETVIGAARREIAGRYEIIPDVFPDRGSIIGQAREVDTGQRVWLRAVPRARLHVRGLEGRMERALERGAALRHRHIVPVIAHGTTESLIWCAMDRTDAPTLARMLAERGPGRLNGFLAIARQLGGALQYAHQCGVIHGDVCPETVLVDAAHTAWLRDFAVSALLNELAGSDDAVVVRRGPYRAPELRDGAPPSPSTDQYALAATLHAFLTGTPPFAGGQGVERTRLPESAADALRRALHDDPSERFSSVIEFVWALGALEAAASTTHATPEPEPLPRVLLPDDLIDERPARGRRAGVVAGAVVAVVAAAFWPGDVPIDVSWLTSPAEERASFAVEDTVEAAPESQPQATLPPEATRAPEARRTEGARPPDGDAPVSRPARPPATADRTASSGTGTLSISSRPWGRLFLDGTPAGNTPLVSTSLSAGLHHIRITRDGYRPYEREILVEPDRPIRLVEIILQPDTLQ
jgi:serine/threonine-protein kinase